MSVVIRGMKMPTRCIDCPFMVSRDNDNCILQSAEANVNFETWDQMKAGCPLVPVPPHGDLIDYNFCLKNYELLHDDDGNSVYAVRMRDINAAPAIIEAEVSE